MIAVDAMGGDFAPKTILQGAVNCAKRTSISVRLFGPEHVLAEKLASIDSAWRDYPIEIVDATQVIDMGQEAVRAVRSMPDSSLVRSVKAVRDDDCLAIVSAGNSGAVMAASVFLIGRQEGIERPALIGNLPGKDGPVTCLDLGANADCKPEHLCQFAHMGVAYTKRVRNISRPRVGLLSNGHEDAKGSLVTKQAFQALRTSTLDFIGNVEPCHVFANKADVVVCDGFAGNVFLKSFEATVAMYGTQEAKSFLKRQGGALLVGVRKPVVVVHGCADAGMIENAIVYAHTLSF